MGRSIKKELDLSEKEIFGRRLNWGLFRKKFRLGILTYYSDFVYRVENKEIFVFTFYRTSDCRFVIRFEQDDLYDLALHFSVKRQHLEGALDSLLQDGFLCRPGFMRTDVYVYDTKEDAFKAISLFREELLEEMKFRGE